MGYHHAIYTADIYNKKQKLRMFLHFTLHSLGNQIQYAMYRKFEIYCKVHTILHISNVWVLLTYSIFTTPAAASCPSPTSASSTP